MKILHLTHHRACYQEFEFLANMLKLDLTNKFACEFRDVLGTDNSIYNINADKARAAWNKYKDYFNGFDCIITSDTVPLSRIFLQNRWSKKLIIWVCNRFDYCDGATAATAINEFPDPEYYKLIEEATNKENVYFRGYTQFELIYAQKYRNIILTDKVIKPIGIMVDKIKNINLSINDKSDIFFVPAYHNDTQMIDLASKCKDIGIKVHNGRYHGAFDLNGFKGIIHIPYAWSNFALFEQWQLDNIYFIPSITFLLELRSGSNFFWSPPFDKIVRHHTSKDKDINYGTANGRIFLEKEYLPSLDGKILFIGVNYYTDFYHRLVITPELFETLVGGKEKNKHAYNSYQNLY